VDDTSGEPSDQSAGGGSKLVEALEVRHPFARVLEALDGEELRLLAVDLCGRLLPAAPKACGGSGSSGRARPSALVTRGPARV